MTHAYASLFLPTYTHIYFTMEMHQHTLSLLLFDLPMNSLSSTIIAIIITSLLCIGERITVYLLERYPYRYPITYQRFASRLVLYGLSTSLRFIIMLAVMNFKKSIFITIVISMSISHCLIDIIRVYKTRIDKPISMDYHKVILPEEEH
jgi:hypothetical protein